MLSPYAFPIRRPLSPALSDRTCHRVMKPSQPLFECRSLPRYELQVSSKALSHILVDLTDQARRSPISMRAASSTLKDRIHSDGRHCSDSSPCLSNERRCPILKNRLGFQDAGTGTVAAELGTCESTAIGEQAVVTSITSYSCLKERMP